MTRTSSAGVSIAAAQLHLNRTTQFARLKQMIKKCPDYRNPGRALNQSFARIKSLFRGPAVSLQKVRDAVASILLRGRIVIGKQAAAGGVANLAVWQDRQFDEAGRNMPSTGALVVPHPSMLGPRQPEPRPDAFFQQSG
jgi:hypothetical protein